MGTMGKKINFSTEILDSIFIDKNNLSIRKLAEKYCVDKNVIIRLLKKDLRNNHLDFILFDNFIKELNISFIKKIMFNGLIKYYFPKKNKYIFIIKNKTISQNYKIKPILFYKIKNRYYNSIFIYEDEWVYKNEIIKNKIKLILDIFDKPKIYARNCEIKIITTQEKTDFLNKNHIQGTCNSSIVFGAYFNNELVSVMSFVNYRNLTQDKNKFDYELNRFATNNKYNVIGIGGKLFNYFLKTLDCDSTIISYGDRRFVLNAQTNFYRKINFKLNQISEYDYSYVDINPIKRIHKVTMQMRRKKNNTDHSLKETEYFKILGYNKIWDCGKYRFIYNFIKK